MSYYCKIILGLLMILVLEGCISRNFTGVKSVTPDDPEDPSFFVPKRAYLRGIPMGDDGYSRGFRAGCETNLSHVGAGTMRLLKERIDPEKLANDKMYLRGYFDGGGYCNDRLDWEGH
jgi:hypothetical protein